MESVHLTSLPPLSLYVHIPWCVKKCPYCDFNSHVDTAIPESDYVDALINDLNSECNNISPRPLRSIFFGGGTPSLFSASSIDKILTAAEKQLTFSDDIEITLEANPGTVDEQKFSGYRAAGVNRLSIGVQSFQQRQLTALGRIHSSDEAIRAVNTAQQAGFDRINIDLMHGLPDQNQQSALEDIQQAIASGVEHISWYQLTVEPNTAFYNSPPVLPEDDELADIQMAGEHTLAKAGFLQYEVSAYSQAGQQAQHNLNYWQFGDYIGIGAGAHGKLTHLNSQTITRRWKTRVPNHYLDTEKSFLAGERQLSNSDLPLEFLMNALRLNSGFTESLFEQRTGLPISTIKPALSSLVERRLLSEQQHSYTTTVQGKRFLDSILAEF